MPKNIKCNGINSELINWLRGYKHLESILPDINDFETDLIPAICDKDHRKRVAHSKEVIKILWYNHPVLGPYPFLETLSDFEFDRQFYQGYRDHASHQLKVYFLGLYFFEKSPLINKAIIDELQISNNKEAIREFHLRWLITAVYHDIGYVIENEQTNELDEKVWDKTKKVLNETLHTPLCYLPKFGKTLSREREEQIIQNNGIFYPTVKHPVDIEKDKSCRDLLNLISEDAIKANLGIVTENVSSPLRSYYEFAYKTKAKDGRPKFRDHGIASSLLLLKVWRSFNDYIEQLCLLTNEELLKSSLSEILALKSSLKGFDKTIYAAAGAISLHNLNKDIWDESEAIKHHLTLKEYWLRLENNNGNKATPLAFLLGLVDSIQCWDRPMYNNPTTKDKQITDEDIEMSYVDGNVILRVAS